MIDYQFAIRAGRFARRFCPSYKLQTSNKRLITIGLLCANLAGIAQAAAAAESMEQAWEIALQRDHLLGASQYKNQSAQQQVEAARANYLPKVSLEAGYLRTEYEPSFTLNAPQMPFLQGLSLPFAQSSSYHSGVTVSAPIFTSGKISSGVAAAEASADASDAHTKLTRSELKLAIAQSYIVVLRAEHAVLVTRSYIDAVSKHESDVQQLFDHGYVPRHDLLATQVALADARQLGLQSTNALDLARASYNRWLGRPYEQVVQLQDIVASNLIAADNLDKLVQTAVDHRQELQELAKQSEAYQHQASSVRAGYLPQLGVSGGYARLENKFLAEDKGWWVGVEMKWDVFDGGAIRHQASALAATAQATQEMQQDTREKIMLQVRQSYLSYQEANARMQLVDKAVEQAEESLSLASERYRSGLAPNSEVLDAQASRLKASSNRDGAIYDRELTRLQLNYAAGTL